MTLTTHAARLLPLLREAGIGPDRNALLQRLWQHAYDWAVKYPQMSDQDAATYASSFQAEYGDVWCKELYAPTHSLALASILV